jgi:hypothetical protein
MEGSRNGTGSYCRIGILAVHGILFFPGTTFEAVVTGWIFAKNTSNRADHLGKGFLRVPCS